MRWSPQQAPNVASYDVNTSDASGADLSDKVAAENENTDLIPLDNFLHTTNASPPKISDLIDETLSGAFSFAKQNKGGYFLKMASHFIH